METGAPGRAGWPGTAEGGGEGLVLLSRAAADAGRCPRERTVLQADTLLTPWTVGRGSKNVSNVKSNAACQRRGGRYRAEPLPECAGCGSARCRRRSALGERAEDGLGVPRVGAAGVG